MGDPTEVHWARTRDGECSTIVNIASESSWSEHCFVMGIV
jgi:hypothetical protein